MTYLFKLMLSVAQVTIDNYTTEHKYVQTTARLDITTSTTTICHFVLFL